VDFLPASALVHPPALRPADGEDARCVEPTSATQSDCVHPHLVSSRIPPALARQGHPADSKAPRGISGGLDVSRAQERFGGSSFVRSADLIVDAFRPYTMSVGVFFPRRWGGPCL